MLTDEQKCEIHKLFDERDDGFSARQELAIYKSVAEQLKQAEEARTSRAQFFTAIGGASAIGIAVLIWSNITALVEQKADLAIQPKIDALEQLEVKFSTNSRQIETLNANVKAKLTEVEGQLDKVRVLLGAIQGARGELAITQDLLDVNKKMGELESMLQNALLTAHTIPMEQALVEIAPAPAELTLGDCTNASGALDPNCTLGE